MLTSNLWLFWTFMSLFSYGLWGIFNALTSQNADPYTGIFISSLGYVLSGIIALQYIGFKPDLNFKVLTSGLLLGLSTGLGGLFFLLSLNKGGNINNVITITAVYPMATVVFSYFMLNNSVSLKQIIGVTLSIIGVILMSIE